MPTTPASRIPLAIGTLIALGLLAGCGGGAAAPTTSQPSSMPATSAPAYPETDAAALALTMADSPLGSILVDGNGMTLYMFANDSADTSACEGQCLVNWPPLLGEPTMGEGVDDSKLGSFTRADGRVQATYNSWPLYYWKDDTKPGDMTGQNVQEVWFVLNSDGDPVKG